MELNSGIRNWLLILLSFGFSFAIGVHTFSLYKKYSDSLYSDFFQLGAYGFLFTMTVSLALFLNLLFRIRFWRAFTVLLLVLIVVFIFLLAFVLPGQ